MIYTLKILNRKYIAQSLADAAEIWNRVRDERNFGASRQCGADIMLDGEIIARVSYNGRLWDLNDKEITKSEAA